MHAGVTYFTPEQLFLGWAAPTPSQVYQPAFDADWCNKGSPTPWCAAGSKHKRN